MRCNFFLTNFFNENIIAPSLYICARAALKEPKSHMRLWSRTLPTIAIEHVWDMFGRRIAARQPPPTCLPELRRALLDEWCNIRQDQIDNLILSMPRRCMACIASSGRHTPY
ncbi:transposable element Tcb1 transposase [Trichonephila clavipes]|nr:transposable element Tcb1 transposase [Trichonephila clavipes]